MASEDLVWDPLLEMFHNPIRGFQKSEFYFPKIRVAAAISNWCFSSRVVATAGAGGGLTAGNPYKVGPEPIVIKWGYDMGPL